MENFRVDPADFTRHDDQLLQEVLDNIKSEGWNSMGEKEGFKMYWCRTDDSSNVRVKTEGRMNYPPKLLVHAARDINNQKKVDKTVIFSEKVVSYDDFHHHFYAQFSLPWPCSNRDMLWFAAERFFDDGTFVASGRSCPHPDRPERPGFVRGYIRGSGIIVKPIPDNPNACHFTYIVQVDPKGWIPAVVVNMSASEQASMPVLVKNYLDSHPQEVQQILRQLEEAENQPQPPIF